MVPEAPDTGEGAPFLTPLGARVVRWRVPVALALGLVFGLPIWIFGSPVLGIPLGVLTAAAVLYQLSAVRRDETKGDRRIG